MVGLCQAGTPTPRSPKRKQRPETQLWCKNWPLPTASAVDSVDSIVPMLKRLVGCLTAALLVTMAMVPRQPDLTARGGQRSGEELATDPQGHPVGRGTSVTAAGSRTNKRDQHGTNPVVTTSRSRTAENVIAAAGMTCDRLASVLGELSDAVSRHLCGAHRVAGDETPPCGTDLPVGGGSHRTAPAALCRRLIDSPPENSDMFATDPDALPCELWRIAHSGRQRINQLRSGALVNAHVRQSLDSALRVLRKVATATPSDWCNASIDRRSLHALLSRFTRAICVLLAERTVHLRFVAGDNDTVLKQIENAGGRAQQQQQNVQPPARGSLGDGTVCPTGVVAEFSDDFGWRRPFEVMELFAAGHSGRASNTNPGVAAAPYGMRSPSAPAVTIDLACSGMFPSSLHDADRVWRQANEIVYRHMSLRHRHFFMYNTVHATSSGGNRAATRVVDASEWCNRSRWLRTAIASSSSSGNGESVPQSFGSDAPGGRNAAVATWMTLRFNVTAVAEAATAHLGHVVVLRSVALAYLLGSGSPMWWPPSSREHASPV